LIVKHDHALTQPIPVETLAEVLDRGFDRAPHVRFDVSDAVQDAYDDRTNELEFNRLLRSQRPTVDIRPLRLRIPA
jgi:hypothetical protein